MTSIMVMSVLCEYEFVPRSPATPMFLSVDLPL